MIITKEQTKMGLLSTARTNLLNAYLEVLEERSLLNLSKETESELLFNFKVITIQLARRSGTTTWVKNILENNEQASVIYSKNNKANENIYRGFNATAFQELVGVAPTAFHNQIIL